MADSLNWIGPELEKLSALGLRRHLEAREGPQQARTVIGNRSYLNFSANDYLGLAGAHLGEPVVRAIENVGWGAGASPLVTGRGSLHAKLEKKLAAFEGTESALLFPSGYAANVGTITSVVGPGDAIYSDAKNHASIIDGCRLSKANLLVYPHNDVQALERCLRDSPPCEKRLIVTDGLFSMDGDLAPLPEIVDLAERFQAMLLVDEAHATGVFGAHGSGVGEHLGVEDRIPIRVGTLSKALGSVGGFVAGTQMLIDWLSNRARPFVYSTALPEPVAAAAIRALEIVEEEPIRRTSLLQLAARLREQLRTQGWNVGNSNSQIIPVIVGQAAKTMECSSILRSRGIWIPGIRPPSVPEGESLLRISLSYSHTPEMIDELVDAFRLLRKALSS